VEVAKRQRAFVGSRCSLPPDAQEPDPDYRRVLEWIWSFSARARTAAEQAAQRAIKIERMRALLAQLGHPEREVPALLVAGTKGKGSTVAMLSACLTAAGRRTARYTSPHLVNWRERTCIDEQPIPTAAVVALGPAIEAAVAHLDPALGPLTTFEVGTAFTLQYFAEQGVEIAVLEVGTGGRFDATNLVDPLVSAITPISYDHTPTLGETLASIAWHKSGILRAGRPGIAAPQVDEAREVIEREAAAIGAHLEEVGREWHWTRTGDELRVESSQAHPDFAPLQVRVGLLGGHQRDNATVAVATLHALATVEPRFAIPRAAVQTGLADVEWPGRAQVLAMRPLVVLDGAHNAASAEALRRLVSTELAYADLHLVLGLSAGKDALGVLQALAPLASAVYLTRATHERSTPPADLLPMAREVAPRALLSMHDAVDGAVSAALAAARTDDLILVTGSLFLVGEALVWWRRSPR
jgi:dihydrofolate synthase/folylpolyglutamate synthase